MFGLWLALVLTERVALELGLGFGLFYGISDFMKIIGIF